MCDDIDLTDDPCPKCGNMMVSKVCNDCGGDGHTEYGELYEMDPLWYQPGDIERCSECNGLGGWTWCQKCGWDETEKRFLNDKPAIELPTKSIDSVTNS